MKIVKKIVSLIIWIIIIGWVGLVAYDFYNVTNEKEPKFCLEKGTNTYSDGTVDWCKGLGYKAYNYKRTSFTAFEFGPFWTKERNADKE